MKKTPLVDRILRWIDSSPDGKAIQIHPDDWDEWLSEWSKADMQKFIKIIKSGRKIKMMTERCDVAHVVTGAP